MNMEQKVDFRDMVEELSRLDEISLMLINSNVKVLYAKQQIEIAKTTKEKPKNMQEIDLENKKAVQMMGN